MSVNAPADVLPATIPVPTQPNEFSGMVEQIRDGSTRLAAISDTWRQGKYAAYQARTKILADGEKTLAALIQEAKEAVPAIDLEAAQTALIQAKDQALARSTRAGMNVRRELKNRLERDLEALAKAPGQTADNHLDPQLRSELVGRRTDFQGKIGRLRSTGADLLQKLEQVYRRAGLRLPAQGADAAALPPWKAERLVAQLSDELKGSAARISASIQDGRYRLCSLGGRGLLYGGLALPHVLALGILYALRVDVMFLLGVVASAVFVESVAALVVFIVRRRLAGFLQPLVSDLRTQIGRISLTETQGLKEYDPETVARDLRFKAVVQEMAAKTEALKTAEEKAVASTWQREARIRRRLETRLSAAQDDLLRRAERAQAEAKRRREQAVADHQTTHAERLATLNRRWEDTRSQLEADWQVTRAELLAHTGTADRLATDAHPPWDDPRWATWTPPTAALTTIPLGVARRSLADCVAEEPVKEHPGPIDGDLNIPVALTLPDKAALLVRFDPGSRAAALDLANALVLRALTSLPASRLKLILVDPVGLGSAFSGLLDLADHDETLLPGGVLVEPARIERGLDDLVAHLEVVIQKHLRGKYATIADYNRQAGELQEALRLVVLADFPAGFSERTLERLGVLLRSGPRCGVHVVVLHDDRKPIPSVLDQPWFRANGLVLRGDQGRFRVDHEGLAGWSFLPGGLPAPALQSDLLARIGLQAQRVRRVEVSFAAVAPPAGAMWSLSAAKHLRIPIGKCGADRLQYFDLGVGTAQHALIGGRTGSGKSTLFHVLVVSASLWYAPREVEFHLIDFKKGVEFKTYATHHLPHARVIAIESDREFGLSVLRNLDQELTRRGDAFRVAGAHDLAAFRNSGGEFLPRILLLIDEFQEFFTEDDAVARDAALLLDRFVRQGRAFGLHVVLGSQTLGGAYTMARSSLGQMGVRIALPCNETDAHLLLHEENDAARLLTRPGDGIYNDRAGLTEGNSPFQVCWLPEAEESACLDIIAQRTAAEGWKASRRTVVFEGNGPSRLDEDGDLADLLGRIPGEKDRRLRACVGQASSLNGATQVDLLGAAGGNLLILGQNREAAATTCGAIILGLAARHSVGGIRLLALDGEDREAPFAVLHGRLAACLPHAPLRHEARGVTEVLAELATLLEARQSGADTQRVPVVLTVFALQRLRNLRPDDDAYGRAGDEPPAERFARILANGPEYGIHTVVWCDSLASAQRGLSRRSMRDFDARILFQMSASDSGELIDDDGASRLGLHTAILSVLSEGRREKFRPFAIPDQGFLDLVATTLGARTGG